VRRRRNQHGAAAVEFALVLPILLLLVFGIIDFGYMSYNRNQLTNAAREGARNGSLARTTAVINSSIDSSLGGIAPSAVTRTITCKGPAPTYTACPANGFDANVQSGGTLQVTLKYHYNWITPIPRFIGGSSGGVDITKTVEMRVE
jgi:Flp pilus assembly protein TadG